MWILLFACLIHQGACLNSTSVLLQEVEEYHLETFIKADYARQVAEKLHGSFKQWFFTIIFCEFTYFENRIVKYTETFQNGYPVLLLTACPFSGSIRVKPKINRHGATTYVVSSNELSAEVNEYVISALIRTGVWKPRSAVIFVINVPVEVVSYFQFAMKSHFELLWSVRITNSVLVIWSGTLRIFMYNPFLLQVIEVTDHNNISALLSKQYNNLYGMPLRLSVFRKIYLTDETGPVKCDSRIAKTVMTYLNATCIPIPPRDKSTVGDLLENGTATGVTADLIDGYTDLELNSRILKNSYYGYIDTTYPLMQDELCFIVKNSERQSSFLTVLVLITTQVLALCFLNCCILTFASVITHGIENSLQNLNDRMSHWETIMVLVKCFLRQTVDVTFLGPVFRMLILITMMYALIVNCVIDAIVTSAITYPRYKPNIDTIAQLAASNLTIGVHSRDLDIFTSSLTHPYNETLLDRIELVNDAKIKHVFENREFQYAILMRLSDAKYICRKPSNIKDGIPIYHIMQECPVPCFIVYGLDYGSPYLPRLNYLVHHLSQAGILNHWVETEEYTLLKTHQDNLQHVVDHELRPLCMNNVAEIFYMLFFCVFVCIVCFGFEIFLARKKINKQ